MAQRALTGKHLQIDKANSTIVIIVALAAFVTVFALVASKGLLSQRNYQARVIEKKEAALAQLKANNDAVAELVNSYQAFVSSPENVIGGTGTGDGDRDGDNARIILDALPSKYDFPALAASIEKVLNEGKFSVNRVAGVDEEASKSTPPAPGTPPAAVEMPFELDITGTYSAMQDLIKIFERSIRPFHMLQMEFSGTDRKLTLNLKAKTYFQPEKTLEFRTETVQ